MSHQLDTGSFRDPKGQVYVGHDRVYRTVTQAGADDYEFVRSSGLFESLIADDLLIGLKEVDCDSLGSQAADARYLLEHPKLPFISYPYEWPFNALRAAALLQLDIYLRAMSHGVTLSDATAYNVQFQGPQPIFIDHLAFRPYREGEYWLAHRQFCEQFLNPLLLRAKAGLPHNAWFRGSMEGITSKELNAVLPFRKKFSWNVFTQVVMQASLQKASAGEDGRRIIKNSTKLSPTAYVNIIEGLRRWISDLKTPSNEMSVWGGYADDNSYGSNEARQKKNFIGRFTAAVKPKMIWDIGCNTGNYSKVALDSGANLAVGFDFDQLALDQAYARARKEQMNFLPLFLDASNPPPNQGWTQTERRGLNERATGEAVIALALLHHLAITKNIPMTYIVDWLTSLAPNGVIEFAPKSDPMVQELLGHREDIFDDYSEDALLSRLRLHGEIIEIEKITDGGRKLIWYQSNGRADAPVAHSK